ncbi:MAG: recombinase family protein [Oscillospiraceae bacterium]|nr:recombinase family protein [Oscillospiraceae bacterium]
MARVKSKPEIDNRQIAVYVRKSKVTESGKSIEIQREKCITLAQAQYDVSADDIIIYEDKGKSGFYADRPGFRKMLSDIEKNKIKAVICYKIDRISRRTIDLLNLVQQMDQKGIAFISVSDQDLDTSTRTGKIMISLLAAIAEFERDIIAERITDNMYELAKEGRWLGGECPIGYYSKKERLTANGKKTTVNHLEPVEDEQRVVKRLFDLFVQTASFTGTATALNQEGYRTKKGKDFTLIAVKNILQNPVYAVADKDTQSYFKSFDVPVWADDNDFDGVRGIMAYNKTEQIKEIDQGSRVLDPKYVQKITRRDITDWIISVGKHKGIIIGADWIRVQNIMAEISQNNSARPKETSKSLLSGLVRCADCGSRMFVRTESGRKNPDGTLRFRYVCDVKYRKKGDCNNSPNIKGYDLDKFVVEQICSMGTGENEFYNELLTTKNILMVKSKETEKEINTLRKRLTRIEADIQSQISNLRTAPESVKQAIFADIEELGKEQEEKKSRIEAIYADMQQQDSQVEGIEKARQIILDFPRLMELVDYEGKLQLLRRVLECVIVKDDKVHIFLKGTDSGCFFGRVRERSDLCHI